MGDRPRVWPVVAAFAIALAWQIVSSIPIGITAAVSDGAGAGPVPLSPALLVGVMFAAAFGHALVVVLAVWVRPSSWRNRLTLNSFSASPLDVLFLSIAALSLGQLSTAAARLLGTWDESVLRKVDDALEAASTPVAVALACAGVFAAVAEELFYRGYAQTRLVARFGPRVGIVMTALLFGVMHLDLVQGAFAALLGLLVGVVAYARRNLAIAIYAHALNNLLALTLPHFADDEASASPASPVQMIVAVAVFCAMVLALHLRGRKAGNAPPPEPAPLEPTSRKRLVIAGGAGCLVVVATVVGGIAALLVAGGRMSGSGLDPARHTFIIEQADAFATAYDDRACLDEALQRSHTNTVEAGVFLTRCLAVAQRTAGFCDGVPAPTDVLAVGKWTQAECAAHKEESTACGLLLGRVAGSCSLRP